MRQFKKFPQESICPICGKSDDLPCVLVVVSGTEKDGIAEAKPTHMKCINLTMVDGEENTAYLVQKWEKPL
jgi:hypothetical protein